MSGPLFLLVYAALAIAVNLGLRAYFKQREAAKAARFIEFAQDPYQIAYLRAGQSETVRTVVFSLLDRGLLEESGGNLRRAHADVGDYVRRPLEKAVLAWCSSWTPVANIELDNGVTKACEAYSKQLSRSGLLADSEVYGQRLLPFLVAFALLLGIAVARVAWALAHGRYNVIFLVMLAAAGCIATVMAWRKRRTGLGDAALARLEILFADLKRRAAQLVPGGQSNDAVLTAALFGMAALPAVSFPYLERLFPKRQSGGDSGSGGDGGSSGDGGGGGGCGGCGGCG
ncbi:hypothetical protein BURK2_01085 [Burkholderiales bacterium]|nr:hypothetical protein BURK2_01085 [Burkholderiales bacterium]